MRITSVTAKLYKWKGPVKTSETRFNTPLTVLHETGDAQAAYRFFDWLVVEIRTDSGLVGYGNAGLSPDVTKLVVDNKLTPLLIDENPLNTTYLGEKMYRSTVAFGRKGAVMAAISAVDIALWDIKGKASGLPVFMLLGGRTKPWIPAYYSRLYTTNLEDLAAEARGAKEAGFSAMKMRLGYPVTEGLSGLQKNLEMVETVRSVIGYDVDLMIEAYMSFDFTYARRFLARVERYNPRWVEEPLLPDAVHLQAKLRSMTEIPLSGGEHAFGHREFADIMRAGAMDIVQFDTNRVGGFTEASRVCALAEAEGVEVIPHGGQIHNLHVVMSSFAAPMAEYFPKSEVEVGNELFWYIFSGDRVAEGGKLQLDDELPGVGLSLREDTSQFDVVV